MENKSEACLVQVVEEWTRLFRHMKIKTMIGAHHKNSSTYLKKSFKSLKSFHHQAALVKAMKLDELKNMYFVHMHTKF